MKLLDPSSPKRHWLIGYESAVAGTAVQRRIRHSLCAFLVACDAEVSSNNLGLRNRAVDILATTTRIPKGWCPDLAVFDASMPNVLIRNLPEDVNASLRHKAEQRNQLLQQYLVVELRNLTMRRQISDVLDDVETRTGGRVSFGQAAEELAEERAGSDRSRRVRTCQRNR